MLTTAPEVLRMPGLEADYIQSPAYAIARDDVATGYFGLRYG